MSSTLFRLVFWAAVAEFCLLRVFLRAGPFLPGSSDLMPLYRLLELLGLLAFNLATLAASVLLALTAITSWSRGDPGARIAGAVLLLAAAGNVSLGVLLSVTPTTTAVTLQPVLTMAAVLALLFRFGRAVKGRLTLVLIAGAQLLALGHLLTQELAGRGYPLLSGQPLMVAAEAAASAAALTLPLGLGARPTQRDWLAGLALGIALAVALAIQPWTVSTITMWTVEFALFLPGALYAAALAAGAASWLSLRREPGAGPVVSGLLLIALAGLKLEFTYLALLSLVGLLAASGTVASGSTAALGRPPGRLEPLRL
ncbi:MAG: hypothetical protein IT307_17580 [Chloroflexi bacterium]|nr:hypothetical protein [Chloroflexota bacterium]